MKNRFLRPFLSLVAAGTAVTLFAEGDDSGWTSLFDGSSTDAWRGYQMDHFPEEGWKVEDGVLATVPGTARTDIVTVESFQNFELYLEWRVAERGNSGIFYQVSEDGSAIWHSAPEFQILDDEAHGLAEDHLHSTGSVYDLIAPESPKPLEPAGEFNTSRVIVRDRRVEHWVNDEKVVDYDLDSDEFREKVAESKFAQFADFGRVRSGPIGLQHHGNEVAFRNIKIRRLDSATDQ